MTNTAGLSFRAFQVSTSDYRSLMHRLFLLLAGAASAASAQSPSSVPDMPWEPTAPYITAGQDEPGYRNWYLVSPANPPAVKALNDYLATWGVAGIVPMWQLLRTASDWQRCGAPAV